MLSSKLSEGLYLGITALEELFGDSGIFAQIDTTSILCDDGIETLEQFEEPLFYLEIQSEAVSPHGEREPVVVGFAVEFEDGEERAFARFGDERKNLSQAFVATLFGEDELILGETSLSVDSIPLSDGIERIEEAVDIDLLLRNPLSDSVVVEPVEGFYTPVVEGEAGEIEGDALLGLQSVIQLTVVGEVACHRQASAYLVIFGEAVYPGHGVGAFAVALESFEGLFEIFCLDGTLLDIS